MAEMAIWLLAVYVCSSLLVMLLDRWAKQMRSGVEYPYVHYRLLVRDSEQVLESTVRLLLFRSYWSGKPVRITLHDEGSIDDTPQIAALYKRYPYCWLDDGQDSTSRSTIIIDLRKKEAGA
ncbi:glycosyltransferase family 2 protein [Brevibacillus sp. TJ4]|uniref:glycosyltransferase family 2 protein n=1 Tax=Brevibacillus sp. TJ4 TaxID=3234853 RepID=UPI0037CFAC0B